MLGGTGGASFSSVVGPGLSENLLYQDLNNALCSINFLESLMSIRVVATTPEKTHNQKFLNFETILNRFLVQFYPGSKKKKKKKKKVATPIYYPVEVWYTKIFNFELEEKVDLHFDVKFDDKSDGDGPDS